MLGHVLGDGIDDAFARAPVTPRRGSLNAEEEFPALFTLRRGPPLHDELLSREAVLVADVGDGHAQDLGHIAALVEEVLVQEFLRLGLHRHNLKEENEGGEGWGGAP